MNIETLLVGLLGDVGKEVVFCLSIGLTAWAQIRQLIPPKLMAKLPSWLISTLEYLAANKGQSANENALNPKLWRKIKKNK